MKTNNASHFRSTHHRLTEEAYQTEQALQARRKISVSEKGKRYVLANEVAMQSVVYAVDGYIQTRTGATDGERRIT